MPHKSTGPYLGPPPWLQASKEQSLESSPTYKTRAEFINACVTPLLTYGLTIHQAAGVTANACGEAAWGRSCYWNNAGGWKITQSYVQGYRRDHNNEDPCWWKARGNVDSGDPDWCFYRSFPNLNTFLKEWCALFVPKPGTVGDTHRYKTTGEHFWANNPAWFGDMIVAGYKGGPSSLRMKAIRLAHLSDDTHPSVRDQAIISKDVIEIWAQLKLGLDPDGAWGSKSQAKCSAWQLSHGLKATGTLDEATLLELTKA